MDSINQDIPVPDDIAQRSSGQSDIEGILDPITVEQAGYFETGTLLGRTDTGEDIVQNLTIDEGNEWVGSEAEIQITSLDRLYAVNGSFNDGLDGTNQNPFGSNKYYPYGWTAYSNGGYDNQYAGYVKGSNPYTTVNNQGYEGGVFTKYYDHEYGSYVVWEQTVDNTPNMTEFTLSFNYLYFSGILSTAGGDDPGGDIWLVVSVDNYVEWNISLLSLEARNIWYNTGEIELNLPSVGNTFSFAVGLYIPDAMTLYSDYDYDNDGIDDGASTVASFIVHLDDIVLVGKTAPSFESVDLCFQAGNLNTSIPGSNGIGSATIANPNLWTTDPLYVQVISNTSVLVEYSVRLLSHRFINSSYTTDGSKEGVAFSVEDSLNPQLTLFAYVGLIDPYVDFYVNLIHPSDWENATVYNPFLTNVTESVIITSNVLTIPTSVLNVLGWWEINFESPNYLESISTEIEEEATWNTSNLFRIDNTSRTSIVIGTDYEKPVIGSYANISWILPNGTTWYIQYIANASGNAGISESVTFGKMNTTAGQWYISVSWSNGTEVAYGSISFDLYRTSTLTVLYPDLEADFSSVVSNFLHYQDEYTGVDLLDTSATILANFSTTSVNFVPNLVRNWWEGDFDTSLLDAGVFTICINASSPYYDNITTSFSLIVNMQTSLNISNLENDVIERDLFEYFEVHLNYTNLDGQGIDLADFEISYSSSDSGLEWATPVDYGNGTYSIQMMVNSSGSYSISISAYREFFHIATDSFTLIVDSFSSQVERLNGTADTVRFGDNYTLYLEYTNSSGHGISDADMVLVTQEPGTGLVLSETAEYADGIYSITLIPQDATLFSLVFRINSTNYAPQFVTFALTVSEIPTILQTDKSNAQISIDQNYTVILFLEDEDMNVLSGADILLLNEPEGISISLFQDHGNGTYTADINPEGIGVYDFLFRADLPNYQSSTEIFSLLVTEIPSEIRVDKDITALTLDYSETYELVLYYVRTDLNENITGAKIELMSASMNCSIIEHDGYYLARITGYQLGQWQLSVLANKSNHYSAIKQISVEIEPIETQLEANTNVGIIYFGRQYQYNFSYFFEANQTAIALANVSATGEAARWFTCNELGYGPYGVFLTPDELGAHTAIIQFEKYGFETREYKLEFNVLAIPIEIVFENQLDGTEGSTIEFSILLREVDTHNPVSGASVYCRIMDSPVSGGDYSSMEESEVGRYKISITIPDAGQTYRIQIQVEIDNFDLTGQESVTFSPVVEFNRMVYRTLINITPILVGIVGLIATIIIRSIWQKRKAKETLETLSIKRKFADARNNLGIIVIHKMSGIPLFSRMLKIGLEESMISGFITAIRTFREEFDIEGGTETGKIYPISDIIRIVSTQNLVIAFITLDTPSEQQRKKMLSFAEAIGERYDSDFVEAPLLTIDEEKREDMEELYEKNAGCYSPKEIYLWRYIRTTYRE